MESKDIISSICFKLKNENGNLVHLMVNQLHLDYQSRKSKR